MLVVAKAVLEKAPTLRPEHVVPPGTSESNAVFIRHRWSTLQQLAALHEAASAAPDNDDGREARALSDWRCTALRRAMVFSLGFPDRQSLRRRTNSSSRCLGKRVHWVNV